MADGASLLDASVPMYISYCAARRKAATATTILQLTKGCHKAFRTDADPCCPAGMQTLWDVLGGSVRLVDLDRGIDGLAGLEKLQVLDVDIYNLDRHAGHLCSLTGLSTLRELRIEPFGERLLESVNLRHGLPQLPHLTKLLIYTKVCCRHGDSSMHDRVICVHVC